MTERGILTSLLLSLLGIVDITGQEAKLPQGILESVVIKYDPELSKVGREIQMLRIKGMEVRLRERYVRFTRGKSGV